MTVQSGQNFPIPGYVRQVLDTLERAGWEAWLVGGCVRDHLLGRPAKDYDVATNAPPERVQGLFPVVAPTGLAFGGVTVVLEGGRVEVTAFRSDRGYSDGRHPDAVAYGATAREDAARRDFTIGALFWHPRRGLYDPTGQGLADLEAGVIRAVGSPRLRFQEDALRILRAARFAAQLGFSVEAETRAALGACAPGLARVSRERVTGELLKLLTTPYPQRLELLGECGALDLLFDGRMLPHRRRDYTLAAKVPLSPGVRLAAFCLGTGLPLSVLKQSLRLPGALAREAGDLLTLGLRRPSGDPLWLKARLARYRPETVLSALHLWQAAQGEDLSGARRALVRILAAGEPIRVAQLAVDGRDLLALGVLPQEIGGCLGALAMLVLAYPRCNNRDFLLSQAGFICQIGTGVGPTT